MCDMGVDAVDEELIRRNSLPPSTRDGVSRHVAAVRRTQEDSDTTGILFGLSDTSQRNPLEIRVGADRIDVEPSRPTPPTEPKNGPGCRCDPTRRRPHG